MKDCHGILVPGGFGDRGIEGMITAVKYARENNIPYFGICLGMQMAVIEFARHVAAYEDAHSTEFNELTKHPVIDLMPEQVGITKKGGTMRLGKYPCQLAEGSRSAASVRRDESSPSATGTDMSSTMITGTALRNCGMKLVGHVAERQSCGDYGKPEPSVVCRRTVSSRIQKPPQQGAPAVLRLYQSRGRILRS